MQLLLTAAAAAAATTTIIQCNVIKMACMDFILRVVWTS